MGVVYKAEDTTLHRSVALKFLPPDLMRDEEAKTRFVREAQAASALDHPNIAVVHEFDETKDGHSFICMAYYDGETLKEKIKRGPMGIQESIRMAIQIADGLERAHEAGIVHRDIKPGNIMVTGRGEVKICDFGIAKLSGSTMATRTGPTVGTVAYMSPEQVRGEHTDRRSDLFALGVVLYEMVTSTRPFAADHEAALFYAITNLDPLSPSKVRSELPAGLEKIILRLLQKDPKDRYQRAAEVLSDLKRSETGETSQAIGKAVWKLNLPRSRAAFLALALLLLLLLIPSVRSTVQSWLGMEAVPTEKHLAVLPFQNIGRDSTNQAFCDGLLETLTGKITQLELFQGSLWVVPASEIRQRKIASAGQAHEALGVTLAVTGSFQRSANEIQLILNLVDATSLRQLRSIQINDRIENVTSLQSEAVRSLMKMLELQFEPGVFQHLTAGGTAAPQAFEYYLQGRGYLQKVDDGSSHNIAVRLFERALQLDTAYVDAYAALASAYEMERDFDKAEQIYKKAIHAKPDEWLAHNNLGVFYSRHGRLEEAAQQFKRVLALAPDNVRGYNNLGGIYLYQERWEGAAAMYEQSLRVLPNYVAYAGLGHLRFFQEGRYADAASMYSKALELNDRDYRVWASLGAAYYWTLGARDKSRAAYEQAIRIAEEERRKNPQTASLLSHLADFYAMIGDSARALPLVERAVSLPPGNPDVMARAGEVYEQLGHRDKAIEWLKKAVDNGFPLATLERNPALDSLRADRRMPFIRNGN